ncbi:Rho termination factor N-terminal domain-containing protein [Geobacillus phage GR1]|nr:Rho termination factor N-terminal domain-containing protein [Geobacillus phage GR1]
MNLQEMKVKELRNLAGEKNITGRWDMNKQQLIEALTLILEEENRQAQQEEVAKPQPRRGRRRVIEVYKDGVLINTIDGLLETFKWATENNVCNVGWVKHSLKTGKETVAGRKFKEGGYLFKYAE